MEEVSLRPMSLRPGAGGLGGANPFASFAKGAGIKSQAEVSSCPVRSSRSPGLSSPASPPAARALPARPVHTAWALLTPVLSADGSDRGARLAAGGAQEGARWQSHQVHRGLHEQVRRSTLPRSISCQYLSSHCLTASRPRSQALAVSARGCVVLPHPVPCSLSHYLQGC